MKIAVIGTGNVGRALGGRWAELGHEVVFGTRDPGGEKAQELLKSTGDRAVAAHPQEAAATAEVVVVAVPGTAGESTVRELGNLAGKVVIDSTNPIAPGLELAVGGGTSAAEEIAKVAPGARVTKAFNTTGAGNMIDPNYSGVGLTMLICGDDATAKEITARLASELGFEVVDAGALKMARYLEPMALLWINLAYVQGMGTDIGFRLVRR
jgi:NADPH-dependent F420 reductase